MSIARRDDRHNADLVKEIADGFNRAVNAEKPTDEGTEEKSGQERPRFVVTGDNRAPEPRKRQPGETA